MTDVSENRLRTSDVSGVVPGTALPWQYRDDYTTEGFVTIIGNVDGEYVDGRAECTYDVVCRCEDEFGERLPNVAQNVRYIVHACNTLPALQEHADALAGALEHEFNRAEALAAKLADLADYVQHSRNCLSRKGAHYDERDCDCGLNERLAAIIPSGCAVELGEPQALTAYRERGV